MEDLDSFEIQILEMFAKGYLERHIQYRLQISEDMLQKQIASAVNKLSARTLIHAVVIALVQELILIEMHRGGVELPSLPSHPRWEALTDREKEVCIECVKFPDDPNAVVASRLSISTNTLRQHLRKIYPTLGVESRAGLVSYIIHNGNNKQ